MRVKIPTRSPPPTPVQSSGTIYLPTKSSSILGESSSSDGPHVLVICCISALAGHIDTILYVFEKRYSENSVLWRKPDIICRLRSIRGVLEVLAQLAKSVQHAQDPDTHLAAFEIFCQHDGPLEKCGAELVTVRRILAQLDDRGPNEGIAKQWNIRTQGVQRVLGEQLDRCETILEIGVMADQEILVSAMPNAKQMRDKARILSTTLKDANTGGHHDNALLEAYHGGQQAIVQRLLTRGTEAKVLEKKPWTELLLLERPQLGSNADAKRSALKKPNRVDSGHSLNAGVNRNVPRNLNRVDSGYSSDAHSASMIALSLLDQSTFFSIIQEAIQKRPQSVKTVKRELQPLLTGYGWALRRRYRDQNSDPAAALVERQIFKNTPYIAEAVFEVFKWCDDAWRCGGQTSAKHKQQNTRLQPSTSVPRSQKGTKGFPPPASLQVRQFISSARNRADLNGFLHSVLQYWHRTTMEAVRQELLRGIEDYSGTCEVRFDLAWELEKYLDEQVIKPQDQKVDRAVIELTLTLSGGVPDCYATNCKTYMKWKWPQTYEVLLKAIMRDPDVEFSGGATGSGTCTYETKSSSRPTLIARGTKDFLVDVAQQLSWLTAAFRIPQADKVFYSDALFQSTGAGSYTVTPLTLVEVQAEENACWLQLVKGTVIARNYPIPERQQEKGLELPFEFMLHLAPAVASEERDGAWYYWGFSQILFPVSRSRDGSIQWHVKWNPSGFKFSDIDNENWLKLYDLKSLTRAPRTFLGYCTKVVVDLGTKEAKDCYKTIGFSKSRVGTPQRSIEKPNGLTLAFPFKGFFTVGTTIPISTGKTLVGETTNENNYFSILDRTSKKPMILYDEVTQRGWMVPMLSVILHMTHSYAFWYIDNNNDPIPYVEGQWRAGEAAKTLLKEHAVQVLHESEDEDKLKSMRIFDVVMHLWAGIRVRLDTDNENRGALRGIPLQFAKVYGWDYMEIVTGDVSPRRQLKVDESWMDFTKYVPVCCGRSFGDVIKPAPGTSICGNWKPIPHNKKCLTATIDCIQLLSEKSSNQPKKSGPVGLENNMYWNPCDQKLFADCPNDRPSGSNCPLLCSKVPQKLESKEAKTGPFLEPPQEGAVVFGSIKDFLPPKEGNAVMNKMNSGWRIACSTKKDPPGRLFHTPLPAKPLSPTALENSAHPSISTPQRLNPARRSATPERVGHQQGSAVNEITAKAKSSAKVLLPHRAPGQSGPMPPRNPGSSHPAVVGQSAASRYPGRQAGSDSAKDLRQADRSPAKSLPRRSSDKTLPVPPSDAERQKLPLSPRSRSQPAGLRGAFISKKELAEGKSGTTMPLPHLTLERSEHRMPPLKSDDDESPTRGRNSVAAVGRVRNRDTDETREEVYRDRTERLGNISTVAGSARRPPAVLATTSTVDRQPSTSTQLVNATAYVVNATQRGGR